MEFSEVELTKQEYNLLKALYESRGQQTIIYDDAISNAADRLIRFNFAVRCYLAANGIVSLKAPRGLIITEHGVDYYLYLQNKKAEKRRALRRDVICALIGAAASMLLERLFPLLKSVLHGLI